VEPEIERPLRFTTCLRYPCCATVGVLRQGRWPITNDLPDSNWFVTHWRGDASLGISYWVNAIILGNAFPSLILVAYSLVNPLRHSLRANAATVLILRIVQMAVWLWAIVGVVRSANRHTARGGSLFWANTARVMICVSVIVTVVRLERNVIPAVRETFAIAAGHDPMATATVEASEDGHEMLLQGTIGQGTAEALQKTINSVPTATRLILESDGGRLAEAEELALRVRQQHLDTYVDGTCLSACTYVFVAGEHRELSDTAELGFHRPSSTGSTTDSQEHMTQQMIEYYRSAGLREWFIDHVAATAPDQLWYPTRRELEEAGVVTSPAPHAD
jgi:hypothetical protein